MKLTNRQEHLLTRLDQIMGRRTAAGRQGYFLEKDDCTSTINSLVVRGLVVRSADGRSIHKTEPA